MLIVFSLFGGFHIYERMPDGRLHIHLFEVDEGDAILITTPEGHFITVDGGINSAAISKFFAQKWFWDRDIDLLILTHPDSDHLNGAYDLLQAFHVKKILFTGIQKQEEVYDHFLSLAQQKGVPIIIADQWSDIHSGDIVLDTLFPLTTLQNQETKLANNTSIVFQLRYSGFNMLFTGDIEEEKEKLLLSTGVPLKSDVLKIAHHGSNTSSTLPFLMSVAPRAAIFPVGVKTRFPHPSPIIVQRFQDLKIPTWNTKNGDIEIVVNTEQFCMVQKESQKCEKNNP
ncbi:MAG: MBL fold metallo-hydrolase [Candidatus Peregrinibacteria bacterium]